MKGLGTPLALHRCLLVAFATCLAGSCKSTPSNSPRPMPDVVVTSSTPSTAPAPTFDVASDEGYRVIERTPESDAWRLPSNETPAPGWAAEGLYAGFQVSYAGPGDKFDGGQALASPPTVGTPDTSKRCQVPVICL